MSLIKCSECGIAISDKAPTCPKCGNPNVTTQTIQATGKKWKLIQIFGAVMAITGPLITWTTIAGDTGTGQNPERWLNAGSFMLAGGLGLFIYGRFGAWWHHG